MEQNSISTYLFRPFVKIAGWKAFGFGLVFGVLLLLENTPMLCLMECWMYILPITYH